MCIEKDLIIIGSYPNNDLSKYVLTKCIDCIKNTFDTLLTTHYPVDEDFQKMVDHYVYDSFNGLIKNNNPVIWFGNDKFYLQIKQENNYAYSVYSCILNGLKFSDKRYDWFFYINGDTVLSEIDLSKLKLLKSITLENSKKALFFKEFDGMVDTKIFCGNVQYFLKNLLVVNSHDHFTEYTDSFSHPYVPNVLESYFAERIDKFSDGQVFVLNKKLDDYFNTSEIDKLSSFNGISEFKRDYSIYIVKEKNSQRIFFVYINVNSTFEKKTIDIKINDEKFTINNGNYSFYKEILPYTDDIRVEIEGVLNVYKSKNILSNIDTYIEFR